MKLVLVLIVFLSACAHSAGAGDSAGQRFVGYYEAEWEKQVFQPCNSPEQWWAWNTGLIVREPAGAPGRYFVVLKGRVSAPGRYGHMGRYPRQILIDDVLEVHPAEGRSCTSATVARSRSNLRPRA